MKKRSHSKKLLSLLLSTGETIYHGLASAREIVNVISVPWIRHPAYLASVIDAEIYRVITLEAFDKLELLMSKKKLSKFLLIKELLTTRKNRNYFIDELYSSLTKIQNEKGRQASE